MLLDVREELLVSVCVEEVENLFVCQGLSFRMENFEIVLLERLHDFCGGLARLSERAKEAYR